MIIRQLCRSYRGCNESGVHRTERFACMIITCVFKCMDNPVVPFSPPRTSYLFHFISFLHAPCFVHACLVSVPLLSPCMSITVSQPNLDTTLVSIFTILHHCICLLCFLARTCTNPLLATRSHVFNRRVESVECHGIVLHCRTALQCQLSKAPRDGYQEPPV